jgi:hypothetical protein
VPLLDDYGTSNLEMQDETRKHSVNGKESGYGKNIADTAPADTDGDEWHIQAGAAPKRL